jgi:hypothetical protein
VLPPGIFAPGFSAEDSVELDPGAAALAGADFHAVQAADGYALPETQHDAWVWITGATRSRAAPRLCPAPTTSCRRTSSCVGVRLSKQVG